VEYLIQQLLPCHYALCASSVDIFTRLDCLLVKSFVIFIQVDIYMVLSLLAFYYLLTFYHPGIGDLNLPVLQHWWLEFNFGVLIFILKRVRQGLLDQHMCHHRRAMH
jgi:hypothetical protein